MSPEVTLSELEARNVLLQMPHVSRETLRRLEAYAEFLRHWQKTTNLVAPSTLEQIWSRHILDSAQLLEILPDARHWLDIGSGGGLPGLVLACQLRDCDGSMDLVESNGKKASFLRYVVTQLDLPARVHAGRIEQVLPSLTRPDVVTARALAPLNELIAYSKQLLISGAIGLFPKGRDTEAELTDAGRSWQFSYQLHASRTDPKASIIEVTGLLG
jgi:16S rRNA (guanine527-N7)-methyltransferase